MIFKGEAALGLAILLSDVLRASYSFQTKRPTTVVKKTNEFASKVEIAVSGGAGGDNSYTKKLTPSKKHGKKRLSNTGRNSKRSPKDNVQASEKRGYNEALVPTFFHCDPEVGVEPAYLGRLRILSHQADDNMAFGGATSSKESTYAYLIEKPAGWSIFTTKKKKKKNLKKDNENIFDDPISDFNEGDILEMLSPEEREHYLSEKKEAENKKKLLSLRERPSLISWLKQFVFEQTDGETTISAGPKNWKALAGAVDIDDSGVVVLVPKKHVSDILVEEVVIDAIVGNGNHLKNELGKASYGSETTINIKSLQKFDRSRREDILHWSSASSFDSPIVCAQVIKPLQDKFEDGIRGDPHASPLDRRAQRRLLHCSSIRISSLLEDDSCECVSTLPGDFSVLLHDYGTDPYGGRPNLNQQNKYTSAFRVINGAPDGFPGWIVDRYDRWLFMKQDDGAEIGPLPNIIDNDLEGVYIFDGLRDRSMTGPLPKPRLLCGSEAPENLVVRENGILYHVNLGDQFSTGLFLDQRPQRAWLRNNCDESMKILNCFAHCGGFSIAAACAGASTVSLDLDRKWLDRIEIQMQENGVCFDDHDTIYGDCFDWLGRLSKRGDLFDIVIVDPPSTSVGKKKKRWSIKKDMPALAKLATSCVKPGGQLWTSTNCASLNISKFAGMCNQGIEESGRKFTLERVAPMPYDHPTIGQQPVKNLVWRIE